jgi:peroxiredoxin
MKSMTKSIALLTIALCSFITFAQIKPDERGFIVKVGQQSPEFNIDLIDGKKLTPADLKGKVVMLQFTASWCGVCRHEMPYIEKEIWQKHKDNPNFVLIGVDMDEPLNEVKEFAKETKITYPLGLDPKAKIFELFARGGVTRNVIIDKTGKIVFLTRLFERKEFDEMKVVIDKLLSAK